VSIRSKIIAGFALVFLANLLLGILAQNRMSEVQDRTDMIRRNYLPSVVQVSRLAETAPTFRSYLLRHVLAPADHKPALEQDLLASMTRLDGWFTEYAPLISSPEERRLVRATEAAWQTYNQQVRRALDLSRAGQTQEAVAVVETSGLDAFRALNQAISQLKAFNIDAAERAGNDALAIYGTASWIVSAAIALAGLIALGIGLVVVRSVCRPVLAMAGLMQRMAGGDLAVEVAGQDRTDEIGAIAKALEVFRNKVAEGERLAAAQAVAERANQTRAEKVNNLISSFEAEATEALAQVSAAATELDATATEMSTAAGDGARVTGALANAAEGASGNTQTAAAAAEELTVSINEISRQVSRTAEVARRAVSETERTDGTVRSLSEGAQRIGDVVRLISDIAGQTNLLALNATIEAARAGDAGKGFAVVASEVKTLAAQTAKATDDIGQQITAIQTATQEAVEAIRAIAEVVGDIDQAAAAIAAAVEEQGAATQEIARSVHGAAEAVGQVTKDTAGVREAAGRTGAAATQLRGASGELARQAETIRQRVSNFLAEVRAA
jgi:methyl-accepting chemotaxis protein